MPDHIQWRSVMRPQRTSSVCNEPGSASRSKAQPTPTRQKRGGASLCSCAPQLTLMNRQKARTWRTAYIFVLSPSGSGTVLFWDSS